MSCCFDPLLRCLGLAPRSGYEHLSDGDSGTTGDDDGDSYSVHSASTRRAAKAAAPNKKKKKVGKKKKSKPAPSQQKQKKKKKRGGLAAAAISEASSEDEDEDQVDNGDEDEDDDESDDARFTVDATASDSAAASAAAQLLAQHVERLCRVGFDREFDALERQQDAAYRLEAFSVALAAGNVRKNRYSDILAHDHSRVALACSSGALSSSSSSDYINANWIGGGASPRRFVSTQGPLESTFADFWRMLWEQNSRIVVMLTREVEKGVTKCDRYWPAAAIVTYGAVRVNPCGVWRDASGQLTLRRFRIALDADDDDVAAAAAAAAPHAGGAAWRDIYHFQYLGWPDHGVPDSPGPFLTLLRDVSRIERQLLLHKVFPSAKHLPPLTVHCSAGIGRSGTFICVHAVLEELLVSLHDRTLCRRRALGGRRPPSIVARIARMRQQRFGMVQTRDQFRFCYTVVLTALQSRGFAAALRLYDDPARAAIEVLARLAVGAEPAAAAATAAAISPVDVLPIASAFERVVDKDDEDDSSSMSSEAD